MGLSSVADAVRGVAQLPDLAAPAAAPQLAEHLDSARQFAQDWLDHRQQPLASGLAAVVSAQQAWAGSTRPALDRLIAAEQPPEQLRALLLQAADGARNARDQLADPAASAAADSSTVDGIAAGIIGDAQLIGNQIAADGQSIAQLQDRIASAQSQIQEYRDRQKWYWLLGPLAFLAQAIDRLAANVDGYESQLDAYRAADQQLEADRASLSTALSGVDNWVGAIHLTAAGMAGLDQSVDAVAADIDSVVGDLVDTDPGTFGVWMRSQVLAIDKGYQTVGDLSRTLSGS